MTTWRFATATSGLGLLAAFGLSLALPAAALAQTRHHHAFHAAHVGVTYDKGVQEGRSALVSDGPGTGFGFHGLPEPYRFGAAVERGHQVDALHAAIGADALENSDLYSGYPGSSVYQYGPNANYGVFTGGDSYGTPFFAGYYGPGDGADYGVFGHAYAN